MGKSKKKQPKPEGPKCPFCGRRKSVRKVDHRVYYCHWCEQMFEA